MNDRKLKILVAHPGRQHSHQAALALQEAGLLGCYATGVPVSQQKTGAFWKGRLLQRFSVYNDVDLPLRLTRTNMIASTVNRLLVRHFPEFIAGPIQYETYGLFDRWVARLIEQNHFDAVIAYENSALHTFQAAKKMGAICILDAASLHYAEQDRHYTTRLPRSYKRRVDLIKDREIALADCIFTASDLARDSYRSHISSGICIKSIPLGVDTEFFKPQAQQTDGAAKDFTFVFAGSANAKKGFDLILDAMQTLLLEGLSFKLCVAGLVDRSLFSEREHLLQHVQELGRISQGELCSEFSRAQCLLLPSRFDSFGMVVAEAMACGLPVIVSDMVGSKQLVEEGRNGFVVPVGDTKTLLDRMRWCLLKRELLTIMSGAARASAERMSWVNYRRRFLTAVRDVLPKQ